jgi:5,10-methylenetetrahydromethanopterin reductase
VRFSVRFNNDLPVDLYPRLAQAAEAAGFDQFWVSDDLFLRSAWIILSAVASQTQRIQIGTCIVNPYTLHPAEMAMAAATLDELSSGRFVLGISSGADDFLSWVGIQPVKPVTFVRDTVDSLRGLWRGERMHANGWSDQAYLRFPVREIPIYIGAMSPRMLRLIGEVADGGLPLLFPPEHFAEVTTLIGVRTRDVDVAACIWCSLSTDFAQAEFALREKIAYYGHALSPLILTRLGLQRADFDDIQRLMRAGDLRKAAEAVTPEMLRIGVVGTARELLPRLHHLIALGARHLSFGPPLGPDPLEAINVLGREVLPALRAPP